MKFLCLLLALSAPAFADTPTATPTWTITPTRTPSFTISPTKTASPTRTATRTDSPTRTASPTRTRTATRTVTRTASPTRTPFPTANFTATPTPPVTATPTVTPATLVYQCASDTFIYDQLLGNSGDFLCAGGISLTYANAIVAVSLNDVGSGGPITYTPQILPRDQGPASPPLSPYVVILSPYSTAHWVAPPLSPGLTNGFTYLFVADVLQLPVEPQ